MGRRCTSSTTLSLAPLGCAETARPASLLLLLPIASPGIFHSPVSRAASSNMWLPTFASATTTWSAWSSAGPAAHRRPAPAVCLQLCRFRCFRCGRWKLATSICCPVRHTKPGSRTHTRRQSSAARPPLSGSTTHAANPLTPGLADTATRFCPNVGSPYLWGICGTKYRFSQVIFWHPRSIDLQTLGHFR